VFLGRTNPNSNEHKHYRPDTNTINWRTMAEKQPGWRRRTAKMKVTPKTTWLPTNIPIMYFICCNLNPSE